MSQKLSVNDFKWVEGVITSVIKSVITEKEETIWYQTKLPYYKVFHRKIVGNKNEQKL